jgi:hypothetical protein
MTSASDPAGSAPRTATGPCSANRTASALAHVVLPTPPLPAKTTSPRFSTAAVALGSAGVRRPPALGSRTRPPAGGCSGRKRGAGPRSGGLPPIAQGVTTDQVVTNRHEHVGRRTRPRDRYRTGHGKPPGLEPPHQARRLRADHDARTGDHDEIRMTEYGGERGHLLGELPERRLRVQLHWPADEGGSDGIGLGRHGFEHREPSRHRDLRVEQPEGVAGRGRVHDQPYAGPGELRDTERGADLIETGECRADQRLGILGIQVGARLNDLAQRGPSAVSLRCASAAASSSSNTRRGVQREVRGRVPEGC